MAIERTIRLEAPGKVGLKFWEGTARSDGDKIVIRFGTEGTKGQITEVSTPTPMTELRLRADAKIKEGYSEAQDDETNVPDSPDVARSVKRPTDKAADQVYFEPSGDPNELIVQATLIASAMGLNAEFTKDGLKIDCSPTPIRIGQADPAARVIQAASKTQSELVVLAIASMTSGVFTSDASVKSTTSSNDLVRDRLLDLSRSNAIPSDLRTLLEDAGVIHGSWAPTPTKAPSGALRFDI